MFSTLQLAALILAPIAGTIAIFGAAWKLYDWYRNRVNRLHVKRIEEPADPDLAEAVRLEETEFEGIVGEQIDDARRWLEELNNDKAVRTNWFDEYRLVVKENKIVIATLYASYYFHSRLLFFNYIIIDENSLTARHCGQKMLLKELLRLIQRDGYKWKGIAGEVEETKLDKKTGQLKNHARAVMDTFQRAIGQISNSCQLYRLCLTYTQPCSIDEAQSEAPAHRSKQWLLYVSRDSSEVIIDKGASYLSRDSTLDILELIYLDLYRDSYQNSEAYKSYLRKELKGHEKPLPNLVEVTADCRFEMKKSASHRLIASH